MQTREPPSLREAKFDIRSLRGPSLYAPVSCVRASLLLSATDAARLEASSEQARLSFTAALAEFELELPEVAAGNEGYGYFASAAANLARCLLEKLDCYAGGPWIAYNENAGMLHLALADTNKKIAVAALKVSLAFTARAFPTPLQHIFPASWLRANPKQALGRLLLRSPGMQKSRATGNVQDYLIRNELPWFPLDHYPRHGDLIQIGYGRYQKLLDGTTAFDSSHQGIRISMSKANSRQFLADMGCPVTRQVAVASVDEARSAADAIGYPVVVKPDFGAFGNNVFVGLDSFHEVKVACQSILDARKKRQRAHEKPIIVEEYLVGKDYRLSMVAGKVVDTYQRIPANVVGDGVHSVLQLVEIENRSPLRGSKTGGKPTLTALKLGPQELACLGKQNLMPGSIPVAGKTVWLRTNANWSSGGTLTQALAETHPDNIALACRIAEALGIELLGVDVIAHDIGESYLQGRLKVIEVNHSPGIFSVVDKAGTCHDAGSDIVNYFAPLAVSSHFPIIVTAQTALAENLARLIGQGLQAAGFYPGVIDSSGMSVAGQAWATPQALNYADPALHILRHRQADAAVVEREYQQILDHGIGTGGSDVSVLLSLPDEPIRCAPGPDTIAPAILARTAAQSARSGAVLNIADTGLAALASELDASKLCLVSVCPGGDWPEDLITAGAAAVAVDSTSTEAIRLRVGAFASSATREFASTLATGEASQSGLLALAATIGVLLCLGHEPERAVASAAAILGQPCAETTEQ